MKLNDIIVAEIDELVAIGERLSREMHHARVVALSLNASKNSGDTKFWSYYSDF